MKLATTKSSSNRQPAIGSWPCFSWQGWRIDVPADWNAVRLEGDRRQGLALLADLVGARIGLRWTTPTAKQLRDVALLVRSSLIGEIGTLAADEAEVQGIDGKWDSPLLYVEPDAPPGRDVWTAFSRTSGRMVQVVHHPSKRRERRFVEEVLPSLTDTSPGSAMRWSVLDLSCQTPAGMILAAHALSAGDLRLRFERSPREYVLVRQVGPATLALQRQPLEKWAGQHPLSLVRRYELVEESLDGGEVRRALRRRWSLRLGRRPAARVFVVARYDGRRDRLVMVESSDERIGRDVAETVGREA